ncbi:MAG: AraC family transcriptional regulator [Clostridia bacterium]|nr:AraC family transcriptional regulator [Clostridia bacterium]
MSNYRIEKENKIINENHVESFVQKFNGKKEGASPHIHLAVEILHIVSGEFRIFVDDIPYQVSAGETLLIRSNATHWIYALSEEPSSYYVIKFTPDFLMEMANREGSSSYLLSMALLNNQAKTHWSKEESVGIAQACDRLFREKEQQSYGSDIAIKICVAEINLTLLRDIEADAPPKDAGNENLVRRVYDAIVYINQHYAEEITAEDCSSHVFLSYSYFSRSFKRITGKTFKDYLTLTRINQAEKALVSTKLPITEIAAACGFNNISYFSAIYKKIKGVSPSTARELKQSCN